MIGGFQPGAFQRAFQQLVSAVTGAGRPARPRRRYYVAIDGDEIEVASPEQAIELLHKATVVAEKAAAKQAAEIVRRPQRVTRTGKAAPVEIRIPTIKGPPEVRNAVAEANRRIEAIYRSAVRDAEIALLMAAADEADDEEVLAFI